MEQISKTCKFVKAKTGCNQSMLLQLKEKTIYAQTHAHVTHTLHSLFLLQATQLQAIQQATTHQAIQAQTLVQILVQIQVQILAQTLVQILQVLQIGLIIIALMVVLEHKIVPITNMISLMLKEGWPQQWKSWKNNSNVQGSVMIASFTHSQILIQENQVMIVPLF